MRTPNIFQNRIQIRMMKWNQSQVRALVAPMVGTILLGRMSQFFGNFAEIR